MQYPLGTIVRIVIDDPNERQDVNGKLAVITAYNDASDAYRLFHWLSVPARWLKPATPAEIRVVKWLSTDIVNNSWLTQNDV